MFGALSATVGASPVVRELQLQAGMVSCLYGDDVGAEVRTQQQAQGLDDVGPLGLPAREAQLGELLVWAQHHKLWAKNNPREGGSRQCGGVARYICRNISRTSLSEYCNTRSAMCVGD